MNFGTYFLIAIIIICSFIFILFYIDKKKLEHLKKVYNPENDASRKGEKERYKKGRERTTGIPSFKGRVGENTTPTPTNEGQRELEGKGLLPTTDAGIVGKNSNSSGKRDGRRRRAKGIFKKLLKK